MIVLPLFMAGILKSQNPVQYVVTTCGTSGKGFTFPGASAPFGMIQWSPDTGPGVRKGGYSYDDAILYGFSVDHLSGAGCTYAEDFLFTPLLGTSGIVPPVDRTNFQLAFTHVDEVTKPGDYGVTLNNGIKAELTAKTRSGFGRFTYPSSGIPTMVINAGSNVRGTTYSSVTVDTVDLSISGSADAGHFCGGPDVTTIYFYAVFDHTFSSYGTWNDASLLKGHIGASGTASGAFVTFDTSNSRTVLVKVGISYVSVNNAKANLETENADSSFTPEGFDEAVDSNMNVWNSWLNKIEVSGGTTYDLETFYSMMYHALLAPTVCSDVNGQYIGYDGNVHTTTDGRTHYANYSGWDIYRCESQFLAMLAPEEASDMAQSLLIDYQQGGAFPRWGVPNEDSGIMVGDPAAPIVSNFYAFGATNFDASDALIGLLRAAKDPTVRSPRTNINERDDLSDYLNLGYIPEGGKPGCVSITLEYASADFALSEFAQALGDSTNSALMLKHAGNWRDLFNASSGYIQMRRRDGSWAPGLVMTSDTYDNYQAYVEGTAGQYTWMVPFNLAGLADAMGGRDVAARRLDAFFTQLNGGFSSQYAYMGNEPSLETPWIYNFLGKPYRTQEIVRNVMTELFSYTPGGCPGNDDLGTMASWYIFGALGMYPELPGADVLVLGSPLFSKAILHLPKGTVTITGNGAEASSPYVQSLMVNGQAWTKPWIHFSDIANGGEMTYMVSSTPDTTWGSDPDDAPPSYPLNTLMTPQLYYPDFGDTLEIQNAAVAWHRIEGANSYRIQISSVSTFSSNEIDSAGIVDTVLSLVDFLKPLLRFPPPPNSYLNANTKYYWRAAGENSTEVGPYSQPWVFTTPQQTTGIHPATEEFPADYGLEQNYPNPFNPSTNIEYQLPKRSFVMLKVFDMLGREIATLVSEYQDPGKYSTVFDASNLSSGIYFYRLEAGPYTRTKKIILLK